MAQSHEGKFAHAAIVTFDSVKMISAFKTIPLQQHVRFMTVEAAPAPCSKGVSSGCER